MGGTNYRRAEERERGYRKRNERDREREKELFSSKRSFNTCYVSWKVQLMENQRAIVPVRKVSEPLVYQTSQRAGAHEPWGQMRLS